MEETISELRDLSGVDTQVAAVSAAIEARRESRPARWGATDAEGSGFAYGSVFECTLTENHCSFCELQSERWIIFRLHVMLPLQEDSKHLLKVDNAKRHTKTKLVHMAPSMYG